MEKRASVQIFARSLEESCFQPYYGATQRPLCSPPVCGQTCLSMFGVSGALGSSVRLDIDVVNRVRLRHVEKSSGRL